MNPNGQFSLPVIDLQKAKVDKEAVAKQVVNALENVGFLYIDGVENFDFDKLLECCKWFFGQPQELKDTLLKQQWKNDNHNGYRGYFPILDNQPSRKEGFEFGRDVNPNDPALKPGNWLYEPSVWPVEDGSFPFREFLLSCYDILHNTSLDILRLAAVGLGIDEHAFDDTFTDRPCTTYRLIHYPPWKNGPPSSAITEDGKVLTTPDHTDSNILTLLHTFDYHGLEVLTSDGQWAAVEPRPKSFVMNIGDVFSRMMGGRFKATRHRVLDIGVDRYSVPFFFEPSYEGDIGENFISKATGKGPEHKIQQYGPWMVHQIKHVKRFIEYQHLPEF